MSSINVGFEELKEQEMHQGQQFETIQPQAVRFSMHAVEKQNMKQIALFGNAPLPE